MALSPPRRPALELEEPTTPPRRPRSAPTTSTTTSLNSTRTVPQSPLVKRLQKQLAELDSYNARPPPVLSRPQSARESKREHRSAPCPRLTAPRASTTIAAHNHAKIEVPANRTPRCNLEISDSDWLLIETLVAKAEARLGVHTALDSSGRPARAPRIKRPLIGPPPRFDGRPTFVRSKAIGARLPASPAAAEILARINTYPPSPFDCEHHAGGAYVRRAPKLPRRTSDTPKAVREVDDSSPVLRPWRKDDMPKGLGRSGYYERRFSYVRSGRQKQGRNSCN